MKLTNYILDLGRTVAYYPGLKNITGSTTASIFLCQMLYWSGKSRDGWIWKTSDEIEEETGLTYNEQKTAKKILKDLNLVSIEFKRLDHTTRYRINEEQLNLMWEELSGRKGKKAEVKEEPKKEEETSEQLPLIPEEKLPKKEEKESSLARQKAIHKGKIRKKIETTLHIIANNNRWKRFIDFVYLRETKHDENVELFLKWALENGFNAIYWTPEKMQTMYPQAYIKRAIQQSKEIDINTVPEIKEEEEFAPMPKGLGKKKELF